MGNRKMTDTEQAAAPKAPVAMFKKRKGTANIRKRPEPSPPKDSDSDFSSSEDESGQRVKRRKKAAGVTATSVKPTGTTETSSIPYAADRGAIASSNDATKQSNWYDEDAHGALSAKNLLGTSKAQKDTAPDGTYKGLANQTTFIQKDPDAPKRAVGPQKASTNVRTVTFFDFKPDVCKDYKQTGFCGYGDACIYLHSREDVKQGWQLDREWEIGTKGKKNMAGTVVASANRDVKAENPDDAEDEAFLEKIPFKCIICKDSYREPVVTRCGHYFCEPCALRRYRKDPTCAACGAGTNGVFNSAKRLKKLLERKRERAAKRRQEKIDAGEEVSDQEDGETI